MHHSAFTLLDLLVTLAVGAIVLTLAVPTLTNTLHDARRTARVNTFVHSAHLARSEAIKRGVDTVICRSADASTCSDAPAAWSAGWIVFVNSDGREPARRDPTEPLILNYRTPGGTISANRAVFVYRPFGKRATNGTIVFCDHRGSSAARAVIISYTGRPRVSNKDPSGRPLRCP